MKIVEIYTHGGMYPVIKDGGLIHHRKTKNVKNSTYHALVVGEKGRSRFEGVMPIELADKRPQDVKVCHGYNPSDIDRLACMELMGFDPMNYGDPTPASETYSDSARVFHGTLSKTRGGNPKLVEIPEGVEDKEKDCILVIFNVKGGYRGGVRYRMNYRQEYTKRTLVNGMLAEGIAGNMGQHHQMISKHYIGDKFSIWKDGRMYGAEDGYDFVVVRGNDGFPRIEIE